MSKAKSMTGYGRAAFAVGEMNFSVEINSVNQRGLALAISAPQDWANSAERLIAPLVRECVTRGKINIAIRQSTAAGTPADDAFSWDPVAVKNALANLASGCREAGIDFAPSTEIFLKLAEMNRRKSATLPPLDTPEVAEALASGTRAALEKFVEMRKREGEFLKNDLLARIQKLKTIVAQISEAARGTVPAFRDALLARLKNLNLEIDFSDERVLKEVTIFADRCDIAEELTRLASHFEQFSTCIEDADCGRKLDFICQEILRELNTIGSKANNLAVTRLIVEAKNEQERIREQVQNIE